MLKKSPAFKAVLVVSFVLGILAIVAAVSVIVSAGAPVITRITNAFVALALVSGLIYLAKGYGKGIAEYYKAFVVLYGLALLLIEVKLFADGNVSSVLTITNAVILVLAALVVCVKNLGKASSLTICGVMVVLRVIDLIIALTNGGKALEVVAQLVLALFFGVITYAKYVDKDARGTV